MLRSDLTSALSASLGGTAENAIDLALEQTVIFAHGDFIQAYAPALMERELEPWITSAVSQSRQQEMPLEDASLINRVVKRSPISSLNAPDPFRLSSAR
jgi:hypothetical protein